VTGKDIFVYLNGLLLLEGADNDYTLLDDGVPKLDDGLEREAIARWAKQRHPWSRPFMETWDIEKCSKADPFDSSGKRHWEWFEDRGWVEMRSAVEPKAGILVFSRWEL